MSAASSSTAEIEGLLGLITSATQDAVAIYKKSGHGIPSVNSTTIHPFDSEATTVALKKAIKILEGACEQLCTTLAPSNHTILNRSMEYFYPTAMRIVVEARIPDMLVANPQGLSVNELAKKSGLDAWKLLKILRLLATRHVFREVRPDVYANNRLSLNLVDSPSADLLFLMAGLIQHGSFALPEAIVDPKFGPSHDPSLSAFMYHHKDKGIDGNFFDYLHAYPDMSKVFNSGMVGWARLTDSASMVQDFPWKEMPSGTTFCDVGGGIGSVSMELAKAHPHLKITLQDLPNIIAQAHDFWNKEYPQAVKARRAEFVALDLMKEGPVKAQNVYYIRHVIHDFSDDNCVVFLKNIRQSMSPHSRLFVHEYIVQRTQEDNTRNQISVALAPRPLLPNYGAGNIRVYNQDLNMMCILNGGERTLDEFIALGIQANLEFVQLWDFAENAMVEFKAA